MRAALAALTLALLLTGTPAQTQPPDEADRRISLDFRGAAIQEVFGKLFSGTGLNYAIGPRVPDRIPPEGVTLKFEDLTFEEALTAVLRTYGLSYRIEDGVYIIEPQFTVSGRGKPLTEDGKSMWPEWADEEHVVFLRRLVTGHDEIVEEQVVGNVTTGREISLPRKLEAGLIRYFEAGAYVTVTVRWSGETQLKEDGLQVQLKEMSLDPGGRLLSGIAESPEGRRLAVFDLLGGEHWSVALPRERGLKFSWGYARPFPMASQHRWVAFRMTGGHVFVCDLETGKEIWRGRAHSSGVYPFWTADDRLLVPPEKKSEDEKVPWREVDPATGELSPLGHTGAVVSVAPKGAWVALCARAGDFVLFNRRSGATHNIGPHAVAPDFSPSGQRVAWTVRHVLDDEDSPKDVYWLDLTDL